MLVSSLSTWAQALPWPTGVQLGVDLSRPFQAKFYGSEGTQYEFNAAMDVSSWILEGDGGWGNIHWEGRNATTNTLSSYTSKGYYFRFGLNYNLLQDTPDKNMAFLGFRYAKSFFKDHLVSRVSYDSKGLIQSRHLPIDSKQSNVQAQWFEVVAGVKVKVWKWIYVGSTIRYKFGFHLKQADSHVPYDVIGWGVNDEKEAFGFNLYLSLRIPLLVRNTLPSDSKKE